MSPITTYEAAVQAAQERQSKQRRKTSLAIVSFESATGTRYRVYPRITAGQHALRDCKIGEAMQLEAILHTPSPFDKRGSYGLVEPLAHQKRDNRS